LVVLIQPTGSFSQAFWLVGTAKVYSGIGADIVMESINTHWPETEVREHRNSQFPALPTARPM